MNHDIKKIVLSLLFGCSLGFTLMAICVRLGLPDDYVGIRTVIGFMPACWVVNFRDKIFK
jgi:hypothetical protein